MKFDKIGFLRTLLELCVSNFLLVYRFTEIKTTFFMITPTYSRPIQPAELVQFCTIFNLIGNIH
ncbi:unnamed protein product [Hymenolepis diminuta]|uniref:Uncharacterized protein n=1 Tax=Hymenolepis diminuta TaxID=6216 RepID=A0A564ZBZ8_HYMDI|nr:unnamed protein product [Hymenolepis diminuta]